MLLYLIGHVEFFFFDDDRVLHWEMMKDPKGFKNEKWFLSIKDIGKNSVMYIYCNIGGKRMRHVTFYF